MPSASQIFNRIFTLTNIKEVYHDNIEFKATRGIDKVSLNQFNKHKEKEFKIIYNKCKKGTYRFSPYLEKLQTKGKNKSPRVLSVPTIRDRIVLFLLKELLHEVFQESVVRKLPNQFVRDVTEFCKRSGHSSLKYFKTDIESFFDSIDHDILMAFIYKRIKSKKILRLITKCLKNPTVPAHYQRKDKLSSNNNLGVPQGISPANILANIYLYSIDEEIKKNYMEYVRYVDDILIFHNVDSLKVKQQLESELKYYKLKLNNQKTHNGELKEGFEYLGYYISEPIISIKNSNVQKFITTIAAKFSSYKHNHGARLNKYPWLNKDIEKAVFLFDLNEKITGAISEDKRYGWLFYFLEMNDMALLHKLDSIISNFFLRLDQFNHTAPNQLKKLSKAYYKAKYDPYGGYIHNFGMYDDVKSKIKYLSDRGHLNPDNIYPEYYVNMIFDRVKRRKLLDLELDVGIIS